MAILETGPDRKTWWLSWFGEGETQRSCQLLDYIGAPVQNLELKGEDSNTHQFLKVTE
jgi:hypothetical protein